MQPTANPATSTPPDHLSPDSQFSSASSEAATQTPLGHVLVVDDMPTNVRLLTGILKVAGYEVSTAPGGPEALEKIAIQVPDVVLLDVMMPGMDGFEVCRRIKAQPNTAFLPVVMVTALQATADRVNALEAGADDFLTKPVDETEVLARVKSLVRLKRQRDELENSYHDLKRAESLRDSLILMLVHDLRTPLTGILSPLEMLGGEEFGQLDEMQRELVKICTRSSYGLLDLINQLLDISKMESGEINLEMQPTDVADLIQVAMEPVTALATERATRIISSIEPELPLVPADRDLLQRVIVNLLGNAVKFTPPDGEIVIKASTIPASNALQIGVQDNGPGIPQEDQQRIFEKFGQVESRKSGRKTSTGLGLTFCKLAVEAHGGSIWVQSQTGHGSTFFFTLPLEPITADAVPNNS